jgi:hypothetical protein
LAEDDDVDRQQSPSQEFGDEDEDEEEGFVTDDARSQVFDDENITPGSLNLFSVMFPSKERAEESSS